MAKETSKASKDNRLTLRMPDNLRAALDKDAAKSNRGSSTHAVKILEQHYENGSVVDQLQAQLKKLEAGAGGSGGGAIDAKVSARLDALAAEIGAVKAITDDIPETLGQFINSFQQLTSQLREIFETAEVLKIDDGVEGVMNGGHG